MLPPLLSPAALRQARQLGTLHREGPVVVIHEGVLEAILEFSEQDQTRERGGFLLGGVQGEMPQYVVIRHFHPALQAQGSSASLTFTHDAWAALTRDTERHFPGELLVGWQHTHPGLGIFLSGYDLFIQRNFFAQPWQIAMVVDPRRHEFGFFHWRGGDVRDCGLLCPSRT
ncbi:MAG: Mov34/MPN/PAD-1 family protein [Pirellulaceae bacterium]|nr:Mov34/MPN/PAD-1 family protein [Pirellulaceae bacterium]